MSVSISIWAVSRAGECWQVQGSALSLSPRWAGGPTHNPSLFECLPAARCLLAASLWRRVPLPAQAPPPWFAGPASCLAAIAFLCVCVGATAFVCLFGF